MPAALSFAERLLAWWDEHGRKDLPWQSPRSAYRVWVAEIMLQQTQVKTVIPYFERFIARFPDLPALAAAATDDVLALWSGLGYYARARNLLQAARICVEDFEGKLPGTPEALAQLPGIGASTANAICSQAFDRPAVVLDGNVKRVLARHEAIEGWPGRTAVRKALWACAERYLPVRRGADYTQAIMDLGATLCTRAKPLCERCPVEADCRAYRRGRVAELPSSRPRLRTTRKTVRMLILKDKKGRVLLERRPPAGIWGGLWSLPADDAGPPFGQRFRIDGNDRLDTLPVLEHTLTHMHMKIQPLMGTTEAFIKGVECNGQKRWFSVGAWRALGLPAPVRQLLETHVGHSSDG
jgi:A/G-specific adenine glycosylase